MPQLEPRMGEFYRYYKGGMVRIFMFATHTGTGERLVVYQRLSGRYETFATPYARFIGEVDVTKHPTCPDRFRFTYVPMEKIESLSFSKEESTQRTTAKEKPMGATGRGEGDFVSEEIASYVRHQEEERKSSTEETVSEEKTKRKPSTERLRPREAKSLTDLMLDFLDERDFEKKDGILSEMATRSDLNNNIIDNLAAAMDIVIDDDQSLEKRFSQLRYCVRTRARFENTRFR